MAAINYREEDDATMQEIGQRYGYTAGWLSHWLNRIERLVGEQFESVEPFRSPAAGKSVE
jgi:hypothetical protein